MLTASDRRKALRAFKQRGFIVHVGALEQLYDAYDGVKTGTFAEFIDRSFDLLSRPDGAVDGILTKALATSIGDRLKRDNQRNDGELTASLDVIDAFTVPQWRLNSAGSNTSTAGSVSQAHSRPFIDAAPITKSDMFRARYDLMRSKTLRNDRFKPPLSGVSTTSKKSAYFELTGVESLPSRKGDCLVLGMLTQLEEGVWYLEDINGAVRLDLSQASVTAGLHTDGSFVIAQGVLIDEDDETGPTFQVSAMGTPPLELRENTIDVLGKDANLFGGHFDFSCADQMLKVETQAHDTVFLFISDVSLDRPRVLAGLHHLFDGYSQDNVVPTVIALAGSFLSHPFGQHPNDVQLLQDGFTNLAMMIKNNFESIAKSSTFVFIPSTNDVGPGNVLPRPPLPKFATRSFTSILDGATVHFASNPCRIRYMTQEIVVMRDDIIQKMVRHSSIKPDFAESGLLSEHFVKTIIDQSYLSPLPLLARPVLWAHHHALWLFPTPHAVVVADKVDGFICKYGGSLGLNPGSFSTDFSFMVYLPAERRAQQCSLDSEDVNAVKNDEVETEEFDERQMLTPPDLHQELANVDYVTANEYTGMAASRNGDHEKRGNSGPENEGNDDVDEEDEIVVDDDVSEDQGSPSMKEHLVNHGSREEGEELSESDDESLLVAAEGLKRIDIKALLQNSLVADTSTIGHEQSDDDEDNDNANVNVPEMDEEGEVVQQPSPT